MRIIEPDFNDFDEAVIELNTYSGDPDEWVIYEQNESDVYYPSFIRYGEFVKDEGSKCTVETASNGFIIRKGKSTEICENKWELESAVYKFTHKIVEKERDLTEEETEELTTMTLKINTHFAAQSVR